MCDAESVGGVSGKQSFFSKALLNERERRRRSTRAKANAKRGQKPLERCRKIYRRRGVMPSTLKQSTVTHTGFGGKSWNSRCTLFSIKKGVYLFGTFECFMPGEKRVPAIASRRVSSC